MSIPSLELKKITKRFFEPIVYHLLFTAQSGSCTLRESHLTADVDESSETDYGTRYEIVAALVGPTGRSVDFRSVWQIDLGTDYPRLITMYPE